MKTTEIGSFEAKVHLSELLSKVRLGDSITITKRGKPVARLVPYKNKETRTREEALAKLSEMRNLQKTTTSVLAIISEGRKQ